MVPEPANNKPLLSWVWGTYLRLALVPVILVALALLPAYGFGVRLAREESIATVHQLAQAQLSRTARQEGELLQARLAEVARQTMLLAQAARRALTTPAEPPLEDPDRYRLSPGGVFHSHRNDGGAAVYYSNRTPLGPAQRDKVARTARLDPLMRDIQALNPLVSQVYLNTHDSLNRIWPWFDTLGQYAPDLQIPDLNFYYLADARHNPARETVWTGVYLDPAGQGWLLSAIAPVYRGDFLEGVVGLDITVDSLIGRVLSLQLPWAGHALLLDRDGTILALPADRQTDWQLAGLTGRTYPRAVQSDTFRPRDFNLHHRTDLQELAAALAARPSGEQGFVLNGRPRLAAWSQVPATGWQLLLVVDEAAIQAEATRLSEDLARLGGLALRGLAVFFLVTLMLLYWRARRNTRALIRPLLALDDLTERIKGGEYYQNVPAFPVRELQDTAARVVAMGRALGDNHQALEEVRRELATSENRYRTVVESLQEVVFQTDPQGHWTFLNPAWEAITGFPVDDSLGRPFLDFIHPEDRARNLTLFQSLVQGEQERCRHEVRYLHRGGGHRWLQVQARGLGDRRGQMTGTAGTLADVSERHQAQERLRLAAVVFDSTPLGIVITDGDGRIEGINRAFSRITGFTAEEVVGQHCRQLLLPHQTPWAMARLWRTLLTRHHWQGWLRHHHRDGQCRTAWHSITTVREESGQVVRFVALIQGLPVPEADHRVTKD